MEEAVGVVETTAGRLGVEEESVDTVLVDGVPGGPDAAAAAAAAIVMFSSAGGRTFRGRPGPRPPSLR